MTEPRVVNELEAVYEAQAFDADHAEHWSGPEEMVDRIAERLGIACGSPERPSGCSGRAGPSRSPRGSSTANARHGSSVRLPGPWIGVTPERLAGELARAGFTEVSVERWPAGSAGG